MRGLVKVPIAHAAMYSHISELGPALVWACRKTECTANLINGVAFLVNIIAILPCPM